MTMSGLPDYGLPDGVLPPCDPAKGYRWMTAADLGLDTGFWDVWPKFGQHRKSDAPHSFWLGAS